MFRSELCQKITTCLRVNCIIIVRSYVLYTEVVFHNLNKLYNYYLGASQINLFVSDDGQRIVSVEQNHKVNVWEQTGLNQEGEWTNVTLHASLLTSLASKETAIDARFFSNQVSEKNNV